MAPPTLSLRSLRGLASAAAEGAEPREVSRDPIEAARAVHATQEAGFLVWWFPPDFCQLYINGRQEADGKTVSNACTIICILVCLVLQRHPSAAPLATPAGLLDPRLVSLLAAAMSEGNGIHKRLARRNRLRSLNLTVPEALAACRQRHSLTEWFYFQQQASAGPALGATLAPLVHSGIHQWTFERPSDAVHDDLFMILIVNARSVILIYQPRPNQILFFDSHSHPGAGAAAAVVPSSSPPALAALCDWFARVAHKTKSAEPEAFELTFLYFQRRRH